jgi:hypothetical protein
MGASIRCDYHPGLFAIHCLCPRYDSLHFVPSETPVLSRKGQRSNEALFLNIINEHVSRHTKVRTSDGPHEVTRLEARRVPHTQLFSPRLDMSAGRDHNLNNLAELQHPLETCASSSCQVRPLVNRIYSSHGATAHRQTHAPTPSFAT